MDRENRFEPLMGWLDREENEDVKECMAHGAVARQSSLKKLRKKMVKEGIHPDEVDVELDLLQGTKDQVGLLQVLGAGEEEEKKDPDPAQTDLEDELERDYRTHDKSTKEVRELVTEIIEEADTPMDAIRTLNRLEAGEDQREPRPRDSVFDVIRGARKPLVKKVESLRQKEG